MPPVPLPSYAIELIRAEVISIVPKRSRKSEIWRPPKIQVARTAMRKAMRIASAIRILRIILITADYADGADEEKITDVCARFFLYLCHPRNPRFKKSILSCAE